jgi:hypothetical protein
LRCKFESEFLKKSRHPTNQTLFLFLKSSK